MANVNPDSSGQPLFIVDRDWLRQGSKARKSWTGNVRNRSLYGLAIQVTQYDVPGTATRRKSQKKPKRRRRDKQGEATDSESQGETEQRLQQNTTFVQAHRADTTSTTILQNQNAITDDDAADMLVTTRRPDAWPENPALHPPISSSFPGLECIKGLECYLDYCEF